MPEYLEVTPGDNAYTDEMLAIKRFIEALFRLADEDNDPNCAVTRRIKGNSIGVKAAMAELLARDIVYNVGRKSARRR